MKEDKREMKIIAFYLPQFHRVPENDVWWGDGYTEWTAVRRAKALFEGHCQPRVPLNDNYYDLSEKNVMLWQAGLMKKYGVFGMCFYHYYFKDGKKILEKPAENLLKWKEIDMPYCFSWANETWARTWSREKNTNAWNSTLEEADALQGDGILLKQEYGEKESWKEHFEYLLPFFQDDRYIKVNGKPMFLIYRAELIPCIYRMMEHWNKLAKENGFTGIYFVATNSEREGFDAYLQQEGNYSDDYRIMKVDYDEISKKIVENAYWAKRNCYLCGTPGYDDTPRRGLAGKIFVDSTPQKFQNQMEMLMKISDKKGMDYIFVNAWNEWGEGMYLEPDVNERYGYLQALKNSLKTYQNIEFGEVKNVFRERLVDRLHIERRKTDAEKSKVNILWKFVKQNAAKEIQKYLEEQQIQNVAIYGMGDLGIYLYTIFPSISIKVDYAIDQRANKFHLPIAVFTLDSELPETQAIIISIPHITGEVYGELRKKFAGEILSLEELFEQ